MLLFFLFVLLYVVRNHVLNNELDDDLNPSFLFWVYPFRLFVYNYPMKTKDWGFIFCLDKARDRTESLHMLMEPVHTLHCSCNHKGCVYS